MNEHNDPDNLRAALQKLEDAAFRIGRATEMMEAQNARMEATLKHVAQMRAHANQMEQAIDRMKQHMK